MLPALGHAPDGGFAPAAGAEDDGAFVGDFDDGAALGFEALVGVAGVPAIPGVAPADGVVGDPEVGGEPAGVEALGDVETAPLVCDGVPAA